MKAKNRPPEVSPGLVPKEKKQKPISISDTPSKTQIKAKSRPTFSIFEIQFARYFLEVLRDTPLHPVLQVGKKSGFDFFAAETLNV